MLLYTISSKSLGIDQIRIKGASKINKDYSRKTTSTSIFKIYF